MGVHQEVASSTSRESVIVVMDADRSKGNVDALDWALKHVVRPGDTVVVLGVLCELGKKQSCFPFDKKGTGISGIWEKLEFSGGQGEINPRDVEEEIDKKKEEYHSRIQPFYRQCKKNEVKLEVKLAAGFCAKKIAVDEAKNSNTRWIVLDSHLKKDKVFIYGHVGCNVAVMKGKDFATLMPSKAPQRGHSLRDYKNSDHDHTDLPKEGTSNAPEERQERVSCALIAPPQTRSPCWYPLSWRTGFPRRFSQSELEVITNGFADESILLNTIDLKVYQGLLQDTPVMVNRFSGNDERFWSMLRILIRVRHRNIMNLVGYCCTSDFLFFLYDFQCTGTLELNLKCDDFAKNMPWKVRWYIALEIGASLRYLHEECVDGPIVHLSVTSYSITFSHGWFASLGNFSSAKCLKDEVPKTEDHSKSKCSNLEEDERLSVDVHDYGILLLELITGKIANDFETQGGEAKSLTDWALPLLENDSLSQLMDPRLEDTDDTGVVSQMARAAFFSLKKDSAHRFSISEVLAVLRGDKLAVSNC